MTHCPKSPSTRHSNGMVPALTLAIAISLAACQTTKPPGTAAASPEPAQTASAAATSQVASANVSDRTSSGTPAAPPAKSDVPAETAPAPAQPVEKSAGIEPSGKMLLRLMEKDTGGAQCREFEQTVTIDGKTETAYGTACRQPDGTWKQIGSMRPAEKAEGPRSKVAKSFPYEGYPHRHYPHDYRGYAPFFFGFGFGSSGGHIGYGVYY